MNLVGLICTYCSRAFQRTRKAYNRHRKLKGDNYKPFCSPHCRAEYYSIHSLSKEGLPPDKKRCTKCLNEKSIAEFYKNASWCKLCSALAQKEYRNKNPLTREQKLKISRRNKKWREQNKTKLKQQSKDYYDLNRDKLKITRAKYYKNNINKLHAQTSFYYKNNSEKIIAKQKQYQSLNKEKVRKSKVISERNRMADDPSFKLRRRVSSQIRCHMKRFGFAKNGKSALNFLPYTIEQLRTYLESKFESWMNWANYGSYNKKFWKDNDPSTWTWQIDHIIPQHKLPYTSMEDDNFKKCWALENLRPYSSKQNLLDGVNKIR